MPKISVGNPAFHEELQRVLNSETFRAAESLRRLLVYLAKNYIEGSGNVVRELEIGRYVMGKSDDYDPRVDASVRVQIGKLRQRLERYYEAEAAGSPFRLTIPKGRFSLSFQAVAVPGEPAMELYPEVVPAEPGWTGWKPMAIGLAMLTVLLTGLLLFNQISGPVQPVSATVSAPGEIHEFWRPFLESRKPAVVVLGSPMFVRFHSQYFRNPWANEWSEAEREIPMRELGRVLQSPTPPSPTYRWTPFGEAAAAFRLAVVLGPTKELVLKRSTVLAWEDVRSSNLIFLGPAKFNRQLPELPIEQDFVITQGAIRNLRPQSGELDKYQKPSAPDVEEIPEDYAVITRMKATTGWGEVLVMASTSTEGTWAAAEYLTTPGAVEDMCGRLRVAGKVPDNYQVVLRSRFRSQVPLQTEYVTHHILKARQR